MTRLDGWAGERSQIDGAMLAALERHSSRLGTLAGAVGHALSGGGKRIRGMLTIASYRACGGSGDAAAIAAAVEIVHAYSLVHDDLPCMDDDVMRRGQPTVHVAHGVMEATVAGVAMVPLAVTAMLDAARTAGLQPEVGRLLARELMRASGAGGMVGGQLLDLLGESQQLTLPELERIHRGKTGELIASAAAIGGIAAGADEGRVAALRLFGHALGLAFQIMDDVLDVTSTTDVLGKTAGRDTELGKSTYPSLMGIQPARELARRTVRDGIEALRTAGIATPDLAAFSAFVVDRAS